VRGTDVTQLRARDPCMTCSNIVDVSRNKAPCDYRLERVFHSDPAVVRALKEG
jgi:hypothetical protein